MNSRAFLLFVWQPEVLNLAENRITEVGFSHLQPHLRPSLLELNLSSNSIGVKGCVGLSYFLLSTGCHLRKVGVAAGQQSPPFASTLRPSLQRWALLLCHRGATSWCVTSPGS